MSTNGAAAKKLKGEMAEHRCRLESWFSSQLGLQSSAVTLEDVWRLSAGHSNETFAVDLSWSEGGERRRQVFVLRTRPEGEGLLEPYDVLKQYRVMKALESSDVPVPKMYWAESGDSVIGRPFFIMEKLDGVMVEFDIPDYLVGAPPDKIRRMCMRYAEVFAAIHRIDWKARGLGFLDRGGNPVERELGWWEAELERVQPGPLPAFEVMDRWLREHMPNPSPAVTLVHGDPKPGNIFYHDEKIVGVFDWEMTTVGDPMIDVGWVAALWRGGLGGLSSLPGALSLDEFLEVYQDRSGVAVHDLLFYEMLASYKLVVIHLLAAMLFQNGKTSDLRFAWLGQLIPQLMPEMLPRIGMRPDIPVGDVIPDWSRISAGVRDVITRLILPETESLAARTQTLAIAAILDSVATGAIPKPPCARTQALTHRRIWAEEAWQTMDDITRLTPSDEQLNHQIPQTFAAVLHSDPTWTEKIWTTIARKDGGLQVDFGLGKYTNLNVMDAFGGVSRGKRQWTVRASRALFPEVDKSAVGPLAYSVLDPLRGVRFALGENDAAAVSFELDFEATLAPFFEDRHLQRSNFGSRTVADLVRYHQPGTVSGWIRVEGETYQVKPDEWFAFRDHSWGIRPGVGQPPMVVGQPDGDPLSNGLDAQARFILNWSPMVLYPPNGEPYEIQYYYMATGDTPFYSSGYVNYPDGTQERTAAIRQELNYDRKTRMLTGGKIHLQMQSGKTRTIEVEPVGESGFHLGLGLYFGLDGYNHGMWRGPLHVEGEYVPDCQEKAALQRIHQLRDRPIRVREGTASGFGIMESTVLGEWPTLGLSREDSFV